MGTYGAELAELKKLNYNIIFLSTGTLPFKTEFAHESILHIKDKNFAQEYYLKDKIVELSKKHKIIALFSTSDYFILSVSRISTELGLNKLNISAAETFTNKYEFRKKQLKLNYKTPKFQKFDTLEHGIEFIKDLNEYWVFKPIRGNESIGVKLIQSVEDLKECFFLLNKMSKLNNSLFPTEYLLEEYIEGNLYSCEFIVDNDQVHIFGVTDRILTPPPYFIELGYAFPYKGILEEDIVKYTKKFIADFQYDFGPCHIEYIISDDNQITILEVNPRIVGWPNNLMLNRSLNINIYQLICELYVKGVINYIESSDIKYSNCLEVVLEHAGYIESITYDQALIGPNCIIIENVKIGSYVKKATSNKEIILRLLAFGNTNKESNQLITSLFKSVHINSNKIFNLI
ncbi:ATP-grasp domain-containing protein [Priestia koreensis]|uniref:ATP-grasp domain-containing protein n=1 Tax=Priestia koreensis TaxID=284581 RepID=UPI0020405F81|nr:ATP-grasp domain-containing protein [Priestia koreensis]MCM3005712.1 ATP-grasp domain-containing protein [Priestia koreensis]